MELQLSPEARGQGGRARSHISHDEWLAQLQHEVSGELGGLSSWRKSMSPMDRQALSPNSEYATPEAASPTLYSGSPREARARESRIKRSPLADQSRYRLDPNAGPKPRSQQEALERTPISEALEDRDHALAVYLAMQTQAVTSFSNRWLRVDLAGPGTPTRKAPPPLPVQLAQATGFGREHLMQRVNELEKRLTRAERDRSRQEAKTAEFLLENSASAWRSLLHVHT
eukprot:COSAG05_NODE_383_length_10498_cov_2.642273_8_plen_228_part_00